MLYTNCEIPAKLFYTEVIGKSNLAALGEGTDKERKDALYSILDEICELEGNTELVDLYKRTEKTTRIISVISTIESIVFTIENMHELMTDEQIKAVVFHLNSIKYIRCKFDISKGIISEIKRMKESIIGMLKNQLNTLNDVKKDKENKVKSSFESEVLNLARITSIRLTDTDSLRYFIELKKMAKDIIKAQKNGK